MKETFVLSMGPCRFDTHIQIILSEFTVAYEMEVSGKKANTVICHCLSYSTTKSHESF